MRAAPDRRPDTPNYPVTFNKHLLDSLKEKLSCYSFCARCLQYAGGVRSLSEVIARPLLKGRAVVAGRSPGAPASKLKEIPEEYGCKGKRLGVEFEAYSLAAASGRRLEAVLGDFCELVDATNLINRLRVVKSPKSLSLSEQAIIQL